MVLYMNIKQIGKRKSAVAQVPFLYDVPPRTLRSLIEETVKKCVADYINRMECGESMRSDKQIEDMAAIGKIAFGFVYNEKKPDVNEAVKTAVTGFEDGLFRVFKGETELEELDRELLFEEGEEVTFVRLTMLAGRMW